MLELHISLYQISFHETYNIYSGIDDLEELIRSLIIDLK
jgi:hypothetical protein